MTENEFLALRRAIIKSDFDKMNDKQFMAVTTANGPVLVLAGAGSGKTTVLVNRIAYLVKYGDAYKSNLLPDYTDETVALGQAFLNKESDFLPRGMFSINPVNPWNILAITFTNKAAGELKERIAAKLGEAADDIWAGTFHSVCGKILRRFGDRIGYSSHFTIYDTDDSRRLMKELVKAANLDDKLFSPKAVLGEISSAKDKLIDPKEYQNQAGGDFRKEKIALLYAEYNKHLFEADAMDFDDMIVNTVKLLLTDSEVLDYYTNKFRYIMVDEYQDTNYAQYVLVKTLASKYGNLCVVGDDDQSIYRFRGATIENILNFEKQFKDAAVIRLEQNYRSTTHILDAANAVIENNKGRKGKTLWTDNGDGQPVEVYAAADQQDEARFVTEKVMSFVREGGKYSDNAVLYRMNAQSNMIENVFARSGIAYSVIGGLRFFDRKEVKDILAYLNVIANNKDDLRLKRIINEPKRGIGDTTITKAAQISEALGISLFEAFKTADNYAALSRSAGKLKDFVDMIECFAAQIDVLPLHELVELILEKSGYQTALLLEGREGQERLENVKELSSSILQYELENDEPTLSGFLEEVALVSDIDSMNNEEDRVIMMTVHSAKGLEFENVYLVGWEEGVFPGNQSIYAGPEEIEEERRLAYVAITRAKKRLHISNAYVRTLYGMTNRNLPSRFLNEIPKELCQFSGKAPVKSESFSIERLSFGEPKLPSFNSSGYASPKKQELPTYTVGQRVEHQTFGVGVIEKTIPMGSDILLHIQFEKVGLKKIMATFAKLKNI